MNEKKYQNRILVEYLLGALPEAEAERFDELCFTDEEFAGDLKFAENDLIDAYINDELSGDALEKFKTYYLASPLRREKVNFAESLQSFAGRAFPAARDKAETAGVLASIGNFAKTNFFWRLGFAAAGLIIIASAGFWIFNNFSSRRADETLATRDTPRQNPPVNNQAETPTAEPQQEIAATNTQPEQIRKPSPTPKTSPNEKSTPAQIPAARRTFAFFTLAPPTRGSGQIQTLTIPKQTSGVAIRLPLESADFSNYRVALADQSGDKTFWTSGKFRPNSAGENQSLNVRFPVKLLKPQIYSLVVSGINSRGETEIIGNYPFRAVIR